jgi:tRNA nucleotidyltransferase/poly(A) polymerase
MSNLEPRPVSHALQWPPLLHALQPILAANADPVYLVGGAVRDAYLRRPVHDFDFATAGDGRPVAQSIANRFDGAYYPLDPARGVGRAIVEYEGERFVVDVARFRGDSLAADLEARDFTMNAMALPTSGELQHIIDPLGGLADLNQKRLRRCGPDSISTDPVRALRAIRQAVALNLTLDAQTRADIRQHGSRIAFSSVERVRDEFMTILGGPKPHAALRALDSLGLLSIVVPEVEAMRGVTQSAPHVHDVWEHTLRVVERLDGVITTISPARTDENAADSANGMIVYILDRFRHQLQDHLGTPLPNGRTVKSLLVLAALLHDSGKPVTRSVGPDGRIHFYRHEIAGADMALERGTALRLSNEEITRLIEIVRHHMRPMNLAINGGSEVSRRAIYRFWKATGPVGVDVCILTLADYLGMVGVTLVLQEWIQRLQIVGALLDGYFNQQETVVAPPPLVNGRDLMKALSLRPGPQIGRLLGAISEAQAAGELSTVEEAVAFARTILDAPPDDALSDDSQFDSAPTA